MFLPNTERKKIVQILNGPHIVLREELESILTRLQEEEKFEFTEKQWEALGLTLETANSQNDDDGAWTDIMFRAKYEFIDSVKAFLNTQHIHLY